MTLNNSLDISTSGIQSFTSAGAFNGRTVTGTANQISVTNGDGTGGNPTLALTSTIQVSGISFDAGSNTLSNYVQGTFTPTIGNTGSAPTITYTTQLGRYTRIGNKVIANVRVVINTYAAGTGNTQIQSLPITSNNTASNNNVSPIQLQTVTYGASVLWYCGNIPPNTTVIDIEGYRSATTELNLAAAGPAAGAILGTTIMYEV